MYMNDIPPSKIDDYSQIETLLGSFNPVPSERFYNIVQAAPWVLKAGKPMKNNIFQSIHLRRFALAW
jgi:hypothetical protein